MLAETDTGFVSIHCDRCKRTNDVRVMHGWALLCRRCRIEDEGEWLDPDPDGQCQ